MSEQSAPLGPGDRIGNYEVEGVLGRGDLGTVYCARHLRLPRRAALSVPHSPSGADRVHQTAALLSRLNHPNLVALYDIGEAAGLPYIAMQYVEGETLASLTRRGGPLDARVVLRIIATIAGALHHAHENDVLHRGITPMCIIVSSAGDPVLVDLGTAAPVTGDPLLPEGQVYGSPHFMSPEHVRNACLPQSDVWGLGAVMFNVLTGKNVFESEGPAAILEALATSEPVDLAALEGRAPDYVVAIVERCLRKDPAERFCSADELKRALEAAIEHGEMLERGAAAVPLPVAGQTILAHVEYRESGLPGAFRHYRVNEYLGGGSFGDVFRATDELTGRDVALKVLKREYLADTEAVARFRREATLLSRFAHANVVRVHNFGRYGSTFFIAMELLDGGTLEKAVEESANGSAAESSRIVASALDGLSALHEAGIVHRDLKPGNIAFDGDRVVVFDLGIAHARDLMTLTMSGAFIGSPRYAAPEQAAGMPATAATDVYAAAVVLYELLTGHTPHEGDSAVGVLRAIASEPPVPVTEHRRDLPPELVRVLESMLANAPDARPTAAGASAALTRACL